MSWSYWINLILFHIFYWQLYSSLLSSTCCLSHGAKNAHLHLNSVTKIITLAAFRRQYSATNFLLLPKITYVESSDSRQFSTVLSYWTKHHRHHNKITIWIAWHNTSYRVFPGFLQKRNWKIDTSLGAVGRRGSKPFFLTLQTGRKFPLGTEENKIYIFNSSGNM